MTINDKIRDEKLQRYINRQAAKISPLSSEKIYKYEYLTGEEILPLDQRGVIEQAKFSYFSAGKAFEKQIKTIEDQGEKQIKTHEEHGQQLVKYNNEKESSSHSKQKEIFEELANNRMERKQDLSKQIDFNNLTNRYKKNNDPNTFTGFKIPLDFCKDIKACYIALAKAEKEQTKFKWKMNKIVIVIVISY